MTWLQAISLLKSQLPTDLPVRVRTVAKIPGRRAEISCDGDSYLIKIKRDRPDLMLEVLCHEYAHALDNWSAGQADHGPSWGVWYSACYQLIIES